jgi:RNA polymerase sigma-70 factor, ECF subfamily
VKRLHTPGRRRDRQAAPVMVYAFPVKLPAKADKPLSHKGEVYCSNNRPVEFFTFDAQYLARLKAREPETMNHFAVYFTKCLTVKLRAAGRYPASGIEEIRQETICRALKAVDRDAVRQPESFPGYITSVCDNVAHEWRRDGDRFWSGDGEEFPDVADTRPGAHDAIQVADTRATVREVLTRLSEKDRRILVAVYIEERDKDDICREFHVNREYLRVLLHRALQRAREEMERKQAS